MFPNEAVFEKLTPSGPTIFAKKLGENVLVSPKWSPWNDCLGTIFPSRHMYVYGSYSGQICHMRNPAAPLIVAVAQGHVGFCAAGDFLLLLVA